MKDIKIFVIEYRTFIVAIWFCDKWKILPEVSLHMYMGSSNNVKTYLCYKIIVMYFMNTSKYQYCLNDILCWQYISKQKDVSTLSAGMRRHIT
jgi:hypothetical protein